MAELKSTSPAQTEAIGRRLGELLRPGDMLCLYGRLGAGKTVLARGVARGLGVEGPVTSPTFILINEYKGRLPFYHFDAYRLEGVADFAGLGYEEYFDGDGVVLVEWADRVAPALPPQRLDIELEPRGGEERLLRLRPHGDRYTALVEELMRRNAGTGD